ncbi:MAG: hydrogen gas-evolving membrane-bound hydrogenase subunit E [Bacillota bacterium]
MKRVGTLLVVVLVGYMFILAVSELPPYGAPDNPSNNEVASWYNYRALEETGAVNIVAGVILDYRAYDTMIETTVLFTAIIAVMITLKASAKP